MAARPMHSDQRIEKTDKMVCNLNNETAFFPVFKNENFLFYVNSLFFNFIQFKKS